MSHRHVRGSIIRKHLSFQLTILTIYVVGLSKDIKALIASNHSYIQWHTKQTKTCSSVLPPELYDLNILNLTVG